MGKRIIYADNAATTSISQSVLEAMMPALTEVYGNPSGMYSLGRQAARSILSAREKTALALGAVPREIYFTSGGTESDNWAIKSAAELGISEGKRHIVTTSAEHRAVLNSCLRLGKHGFEITYLPVDEYGLVTPQQVENALRKDTCLVSVMFANNEIGTIEPVAAIGEICRSRGVLFHTDAVQAVGHIPIDLGDLPIDMLSLSGHKLHAPKGTGALYVRSGLILPAFMDGGSQERGRRAGTENVAGILGLGQAMEDAAKDIPARAERIVSLRNRLTDGLLSISGTRLNGHPSNRLPGNVNISISGITAETLLLMLDSAGICASSGAACASGAAEPSHVLKAIGLSDENARASLRFTLGEDISKEDTDFIIEEVSRCVKKLRNLGAKIYI